MAEYKIPLIAVVGPTASGKTSLAVELCKRLNGEVVSCDSMQIYKGMDIATAKPTEEEMCSVPHHLIDFAEPDEIFSVAKYCELAKRIITGIYSCGRIPVLAGGTGLYYSSLVDNIVFFDEETDFEYRELLRKRAESEGPQALLDELRGIDPESAETLHANNLGRIIRALEIYHTTGRTKTEQNKNSRSNPSPYDVIPFCLDCKDREYLYDRINSRVDMMLKDGLLEEAEKFYSGCYGRTAVQAIGYKELKPYIDGESSLEECTEMLKMQTRRYAKRQLTWFRRDERMNYLYIDEIRNTGELADKVITVLRQKRPDVFPSDERGI